MSNNDNNKEPAEDPVDLLQERQELVQDVIDRLLSNPNYKAALIQLNSEYPALKDYNRRLEKSRDENNTISDEPTGKTPS